MRWLWVAPLLAAAGFAQDTERPLPVRQSMILSRGGVTYTVEGEQTIPWGCEISIARGIKIVGKGQGATLIVAGSLQIHGVDTKEVEIENLVIRPAPKFQEIRLDMVRFNAPGRLTNDKAQPVAGSIVVENTDFARGVGFDVTMTGGKVDMFSSSFLEPTRITAVAPEGKRCTLKISLNGNFYHTTSKRKGGVGYSGFLGGLFVTGGPDVLVRNNRIGGAKSEFIDCAKLTFDGNKVDSATLILRQSAAGGFRKTKLSKCDFYCGKLVLSAPAGRTQRVMVDKCWFRGRPKAKDVDTHVVVDGKDDKECSVVASYKALKKKPLELAGKANQ